MNAEWVWIIDREGKKQGETRWAEGRSSRVKEKWKCEGVNQPSKDQRREKTKHNWDLNKKGSAKSYRLFDYYFLTIVEEKYLSWVDLKSLWNPMVTSISDVCKSFRVWHSLDKTKEW